MTPLQMIAEWRKGCSCAPAPHPERCASCTVALIDALERKLAPTPADLHGHQPDPLPGMRPRVFVPWFQVLGETPDNETPLKFDD